MDGGLNRGHVFGLQAPYAEEVIDGFGVFRVRELAVLFVATFWINLYEFSTTKVQDVVTSTSADAREKPNTKMGNISASC